MSLRVMVPARGLGAVRWVRCEVRVVRKGGVRVEVGKMALCACMWHRTR